MPIAIDIIENTVYIAEGNVTAGGVEVHKSDEIRLPEGTVEDGDIKNRSALVTSISKILKAHSFKSKSAVVTFTSSMAITRRLSLPFGKMKEIAGMVKNQIAQSVGDPADYVFEFSFAGGEKVKSSEIDVWAFAIEKELVDKYYSIFKSIKLRPAALDIHPNCIQKAIQGSAINGQDLNGKSTLFVDIEREFVEIHLFNGYMREFSRIAPVSASDFILISNSLGYGRKPDAAEDNMHTETKLKSPLESISYEMIDVSPDMLKLDSILENAAKQYTNKINDELSKMIQFQLMRNSAVPVSRIYIYGGLSGIRGLDANISQLLSYPVDIIQSVSKVKPNPNVQISKYLNAIGSIIRIK